MSLTRRTLLKNLTLTAGGASLLNFSAFTKQASVLLTGIQLYSVRDEMKTVPLGTQNNWRQWDIAT
jgi:hypothetical protein